MVRSNGAVGRSCARELMAEASSASTPLSKINLRVSIDLTEAGT
jgi:hypothetical protein